MTISSNKATLLIQENNEIIQDKQTLIKSLGQSNLLQTNLLKTQIKNRESVIKSLETFIK